MKHSSGATTRRRKHAAAFAAGRYHRSRFQEEVLTTLIWWLGSAWCCLFSFCWLAWFNIYYHQLALTVEKHQSDAEEVTMTMRTSLRMHPWPQKRPETGSGFCSSSGFSGNGEGRTGSSRRNKNPAASGRSSKKVSLD